MQSHYFVTVLSCGHLYILQWVKNLKWSWLSQHVHRNRIVWGACSNNASLRCLFIDQPRRIDRFADDHHCAKTWYKEWMIDN